MAAWIGEEAEDSRVAVEFIQGFHPHPMPSKASIPQAEEKPSAEICSALTGLLERPYWRRVWIIQEIALSRSTMVHCGNLTFQWKSLALAVASFDSSSSLELALEPDPSDVLARKPSFLNIWNLNQFNTDAFESKPVKFFEALRRSLEALSTEPRDKIFALLGLVYDSAMYVDLEIYIS